MQVEVSGEVDERVESFVRRDRVLHSREVTRTVSQGTQHGWSKPVGPGRHIQEEDASARSDAAKGVSAGNKHENGSQHVERSGRMVRMMGLCVSKENPKRGG